jgi:hypothetical protein
MSSRGAGYRKGSKLIEEGDSLSIDTADERRRLMASNFAYGCLLRDALRNGSESAAAHRRRALRRISLTGFEPPCPPAGCAVHVMRPHHPELMTRAGGTSLGRVLINLLSDDELISASLRKRRRAALPRSDAKCQ